MVTIWLLFVLVIIFVYFAVEVYRHDDTRFSKLTGYSYFDIWTNKKAKAASKLVGALDKVEGSHKILIDLKIQSEQGVHHIDAVLIHESGIYASNVKELTGWINGREQDIQWTQLLHRDKSKLFNNPVHEIKRAIFALQEYLPEVNTDYFETLVLFTNDCSFQEIELESDNVDVIKTTDLKKWLKQLEAQVLTKTEIESIYSALQGMMQVKKKPILEKTKIASSN